MQRRSAGLVIGFHGCERATARDLLAGKAFALSRNPYDWLGSGVYFFEADARRARMFLEQSWRRSPPAKALPIAAVIGAFIDLGHCLDLTTQDGIADVGLGYESLADQRANENRAMPKNRGGAGNPLRDLDCAVINHVHDLRALAGDSPYTTVRGAFPESGSAYPGSDLTALGHIQIAARDPQAILGLFRPETGGWRT